jgi:hypothetical protein
MKKVLIFVIATLLFVACGGNRPSEEIQKEIFNGMTEKEYRKYCEDGWGLSKSKIDEGIKKMYDEYYAEQAEEEAAELEKIKREARQAKINDSIRKAIFYPRLEKVKALMKKDYKVYFPEIVLKEFYFLTSEGLDSEKIVSYNWYALKPQNLETESTASHTANDGSCIYDSFEDMLIDVGNFQNERGADKLLNEEEYYQFLERVRSKEYSNAVKAIKVKL